MYANNPVTTRRVIGAAVSVACLLIATGAAAGDRDVTVVIHATSEGLNLARAADAQAFYQRIRSAALVACTRADRVGLAPVADVDDCVEDSLAEAIRRTNIAALTQVYLDRHSAPVAAAHGISVPATVAAQ